MALRRPFSALGSIGCGVLLLVAAPTAARLLVAGPATMAVSGFVQARLRFCAGFGLAGLANFDALGQEARVPDAADRAADRRKALLIHAGSAVAGLLVGLAFALLPVAKRR